MRRIAAAVAGLSSLVAAAMLATVWYDDGTAARRGLAVLGPIDGNPDEVPGLGWLRTAAVLAAVAALAAAAAAVAATRWSRRPEPTPPAPPRVPSVLPPAPVAPVDEGLRTAAIWAAAWSGLAAVALGLAAWRLEGRATPAVPRTTLLLAGAAAAWALVAVRARRAWPAAVAVAAVLALAAPLAGPWWAYGRLVEHGTTTAAPAPGGPGPDRPGAVRWHRPALGSLPLGPYVLVRERTPDRVGRIVVVDAATGAERWSYRHDDASVSLSGDPTTDTVTLGVNRDGAQELRVFDLPTGRPLWNRRDAGDVVGRNARFDSDGIVAPAGVLLLLDHRATRLRALDPRTGEPRWERTVDRECAASAAYVRAGDVLVQTSLCRRRTVPAFRVDTGADAWTATVAATDAFSRGPSRSPLVAGGLLLLWTSDDERVTMVALDPASGAERWRRVSRPGVLPAAVTAGRIVLAERDERRRLVAVAVDPATGRTAWTTVLPRQPRPGARGGELVAGSDGEHWYLLSGVFPGGPRTTWLTVLDGAGRPLGTGELAGCPRACTDGQVLPADEALLTAAGGTLVVLPSRYGLDRDVVGITSGPAFVPDQVPGR